MSDLAEAFFDNVIIPCPRCDGHDVTVYSYTNDANLHIIEGVCADCQCRWSMG